MMHGPTFIRTKAAGGKRTVLLKNYPAAP